MAVRERESVVEVDAGLHVIQYAGSEAASPPSVHVSVAQGSRSRVEIIHDPREPAGALSRPGSVLVLRAEERATMRLLVRPTVPNGSTDARIEVRALGQGARPKRSAQPSPRAQAAPVSAKSGGLRVLGHVARRGDIWAEAGKWVGGPASPAPVEGIEIHLDSSQDVGLEYQVLSGKRQPRWSAWTASGSFAGTRGRAQPLLGVRLRVRGGYELRAEALFLGAAIITKTGSELELVGQTAREPLVGLAISLASGVPAAALTPVPADRGARVRVFRASSV